MKLRELNEDRNEDKIARAKRNFIQDLVTNLEPILSKLNMPKVATSATSSVPTQSATPETPEQKRIRLQKAAQQNIDKTAVPSSKSSSTVSRKSTPSVDDVINPKYTPGPMPDGFTQINLFRPGDEPQIRYVHKSHLQSWLQNGWKKGAGDGSATWTDQAAQTRQQKQASAAQAAQAGMTTKPVVTHLRPPEKIKHLKS